MYKRRASGGLAAAYKRRRFGTAAITPTQIAAALAARRSRMNLRNEGFTGMELKFVDYEYNDAIPATLAGAEADPPNVGAQTTPGCISAIAQGDGESNRDGRRAVLKSVMIEGLVVIDATAASSLANGGSYKIALVWDKQTNGSQLSAENVYVDPTSTSLDALTPRNLQFSQRFQVLAEKTLVVQPKAGAGDGTTNDSPATYAHFKIYRKLNIPVNFTGTTAVVSAIADNSLHVIAVKSDAAAAAANLRYYSRVRFVG